MESFEDKQVPCKHDGCDVTWTWSAEAQLSTTRKGRGTEPPRRMCDKCKQFLNKAETQTLACESCSTSITWPKEHQLMVELGTWVKPSLCSDCRRETTPSETTET